MRRPGHPTLGGRGLSRAFGLLVASIALIITTAACQGDDSRCCVEHIRGCVDALDICAWQCNDQGGQGDCYMGCVDTLDQCTLACEDE